jgi:serine phosphatase RsbU (regulator of sigma subunit)
VFCSDGVFEAMNSRGDEYTSERLAAVVGASRGLSTGQIVDAIVRSVDEHRAGFPPNDDTTVVVVKITA